MSYITGAQYYTNKMADDGYDFFAPQPKPTPRAKNTMFDIVPDAFNQKTLELTGDHRRVKRDSEAGTKADESVQPTPGSEGKAPVDELIKQDTIYGVEAEKWQGVGLSKINCSFSNFLSGVLPLWTTWWQLDRMACSLILY